MANLLKFNS